MSHLSIVDDQQQSASREFSDGADIARELDKVGVLFERWQADTPVADDASQEAIIAAYQGSIDRLKEKYGFQSVDVVSLTPDHPDKDMFRKKFLDEHTHSEFEIRYFIDGKGLFIIHQDDQVYSVLCEKGDLISVPAGTRHWFDMGSQPFFKCIRFFTSPDGWTANFTGDDIASRFPKLD